MTAQVKCKRCTKCGYQVLRSYFKHHVCRSGDTWFPHAKEREQGRLRKLGRA